MQSKPELKLITITPELAEKYLSHNTHNRRIRNRHISKLEDALRRGEWMQNGDPIRFDKNGTLIDGQHRLWAVFNTGIPVEMYVMTGLEPEAQYTIDVGAKRNLADALRLEYDLSDAFSVSACVTMLWRFDHGLVGSDIRPSVLEGLEYFKNNPGIADSVKEVQYLRKRLGLPGSVVAAANYLFANLDQAAADTFFQLLQDGTVDVDNPIHWTREHFIIRMANPGPKKGIGAASMLALLIKTWNAWIQGVKPRAINALLWKPYLKKPEPFPVPINPSGE